jgi:hypothetical protein
VEASPSCARYDAAHGFVLLDTLVSTGAGWQLQHTTGINDAGKIVGTGQFHGSTDGFLLTPR